MRIKIIGDGTFPGSKVVNEKTGEIIEGVVGCEIVFSQDTYPVYSAKLTIRGPKFDIESLYAFTKEHMLEMLKRSYNAGMVHGANLDFLDWFKDLAEMDE